MDYPIKKIYLLKSTEKYQYQIGWYTIKVDKTFSIDRIDTIDDKILFMSMSPSKYLFNYGFKRHHLDIISRDIINLEQKMYCTYYRVKHSQNKYLCHFRLEFNDYIRFIRNKKITEIYDQ